MTQKQKKPKTKIGHSLEQLQDGLILTIQDKPVLKNGDINQQDDVFQNVQKRLQNEADHNRELKQKLKKIANVATSHIEAKNQGLATGILPHYDDHRYKSDQVDLEDGTVTKRSRPKLPKNTANDFQQTPQNINTEYYQRTKFKTRKKEKPNTFDLLNFLNETAYQKQLPNEVPDASADDIIEQSLNTVRKRRKIENEDLARVEQVLGNQDQELLARAIKIGRQRDMGKGLMSIIKEEEEDGREDRPCTEIEMNPVNYRQTNVSAEVKKNYNIVDAAKGTTSCLFVNLPSQKIALKKQQPQLLSFSEISPQTLQKMKQEISFLEQRQAGMGLAGTLQYLRQNNLINKQQQFGRTNDKESNHNQPGDRIKLQYRNASGKLMKPKEAFRYLSAIFHGQGPGKNKIEKIKKKEILEMKMKEAASQPGKLMTLLEKHQGKTGEAHMVVQLGSKNKE